MSRTHADAPASASTISRDCRDTSSRSRITVAPVRSLASGKARASRSAMTSAARRGPAPARPRGRGGPIALEVDVGAVLEVIGREPQRQPQLRCPAVGNSKPRGITPTTTCGMPLSDIVVPSTSGRAGERRAPETGRPSTTGARRAAGLVGGHEGAAERRWHAERSRRARSSRRPRRGASASRRRCALTELARERGHRLEAGALPLPVLVVARRQLHSRVARVATGPATASPAGSGSRKGSGRTST